MKVRVVGIAVDEIALSLYELLRWQVSLMARGKSMLHRLARILGLAFWALVLLLLGITYRYGRTWIPHNDHVLTVVGASFVNDHRAVQVQIFNHSPNPISWGRVAVEFLDAAHRRIGTVAGSRPLYGHAITTIEVAAPGAARAAGFRITGLTRGPG
jgi:hypothetical protein